jgi:hypothetical protein
METSSKYQCPHCRTWLDFGTNICPNCNIQTGIDWQQYGDSPVQNNKRLTMIILVAVLIGILAGFVAFLQIMI